LEPGGEGEVRNTSKKRDFRHQSRESRFDLVRRESCSRREIEREKKNIHPHR
jgi:hypothetical protein